MYLGVLFLLAMAALFVAARSYGRSAANASFDHLLVASALSIADHITLENGHWQVDLPYAALDVLALAPDDRVFYRISSADGETLSGYDDLPLPPARNSRGKAFRDITYRGEAVRVASIAHWLASPRHQGWVYVQVAQTTLARSALANDIAWRATLAIAALTLAAMLLGWVAVHRALRPLARLKHELQTREPSHLQPLRGPVPQELQQLVAALNRFMTRLSESQDTLRAFIGEAAHQLRTPLAALRAQAQNAIDEDDPQEQRLCLLAIERNADALSRLTHQLLSDASVSHRDHLRRFEMLDLAEVVHQALRDTLTYPCPELQLHGLDRPAPLYGDALMLREAVKNLFDNANKYGALGTGPLTVSIEHHAGAWLLRIADQGPGIPAKNAENVFERFRRGDETTARGAGLGLAIVRRVVTSHGGTVALRNLRPRGLEVCVTLPGAPCA